MRYCGLHILNSLSLSIFMPSHSASEVRRPNVPQANPGYSEAEKCSPRCTPSPIFSQGPCSQLLTPRIMLPEEADPHRVHWPEGARQVGKGFSKELNSSRYFQKSSQGPQNGCIPASICLLSVQVTHCCCYYYLESNHPAARYPIGTLQRHCVKTSQWF